MVPILFSIPVFLILSVVQSVAISRITFLAGNADIILLAIISWIIVEEEGNFVIWALVGGFFISILSAIPLSVVILTYLSVAGITKILHRIFWQSPILTIFISTTIGTISKFLIDIIYLQFSNIPAPISISIGSILLPSLLLNLFFAFPTYLLMSDLSNWVSPKEEKYV